MSGEQPGLRDRNGGGLRERSSGRNLLLVRRTRMPIVPNYSEHDATEAHRTGGESGGAGVRNVGHQ